MRRLLSFTLGIFIIIALLVPAAWAQQPGQQQQPQQRQMRQLPKPKINASDVTDQDLEAATDVLIAMQDVRAKYVPKMKNVKSRKEAMKLRKQMAMESQRIVKANEDIETPRFQQIMLLARQDTTFRKRLTDHVKAKSKAAGKMKGDQDDSDS